MRARLTLPGALPPMEMNRYDLDRIVGLVQQVGVDELMLRLTDHGGTPGAVLHFRR